MSDRKEIDIRDVLRAATPGPWKVGKPYLDDEGFREIPLHSETQGMEVTPAAVFLQFPHAGDMQMANAALICWLRNNAEHLIGLASKATSHEDNVPAISDETFSEAIHSAVELHGVDKIAALLRVARPTIERWKTGQNLAHPAGRRSVFEALKTLSGQGTSND